VAEWLGRALQKLLQQFESARYLHVPVPPIAGGIFFMLTPEEEKFVHYWEAQRQNRKSFLRKFSIILPVVSLLTVLFFVNFMSGWYGKADRELRRHSSVIVVILIAVVAIVVFVAIFTARHKWEQNEADYQALLKKRGDQGTHVAEAG
jgi:uncharacterized membrane protein YcjF (UPF0283 family)